MDSSESVRVNQQIINAYLQTRSDMPGVGVLTLLYGLFIPAQVDGLEVRPQIGAVPGTVLAFSNETSAWAWLADHPLAAPHEP